jgi:hypothetical protein
MRQGICVAGVFSSSALVGRIIHRAVRVHVLRQREDAQLAHRRANTTAPLKIPAVRRRLREQIKSTEAV